MRTFALVSFVLLVVSVSCLTGAEEKRLDFWDEELSLFGCGQAVDVDKALGREAFSLDYTDKRERDFSVLYAAATGGNAEAVWFTPGPWIRSWSLGEN